MHFLEMMAAYGSPLVGTLWPGLHVSRCFTFPYIEKLMYPCEDLQLCTQGHNVSDGTKH